MTPRYEDARLVEVSSLPVYWIDGLARLHVMGPIVRYTAWEFRRLTGEVVKFPVFDVLRPVATDLSGQFNEMLRRELGAGVDSQLQH